MFESIAQSIAYAPVTVNYSKNNPPFSILLGKENLDRHCFLDGNSVGDFFSLNYIDYRPPKTKNVLILEQRKTINPEH